LAAGNCTRQLGVSAAHFARLFERLPPASCLPLPAAVLRCPLPVARCLL